PELLVQTRAEVAIGLERLGLPAGAIQREHQLAAKALAQRIAPHEHLELARKVRVAAEREVGLDAVFPAGEMQLLQVRLLDSREGLRDLPERGPAPERERRGQRRGRA